MAAFGWNCPGNLFPVSPLERFPQGFSSGNVQEIFFQFRPWKDFLVFNSRLAKVDEKSAEAWKKWWAAGIELMVEKFKKEMR